jgi:double-stranded uracil-DNA glycosylase
MTLRPTTSGDVNRKPGLPPVANENSRVLILGSLPGDESLRLQRYYANPSNRFWSLLAGVLGAPVGSTHEQRLADLQAHGIALWDVLQSADRHGSGDNAIRRERPNDFVALFTEFPDLRRVAFNGTEAATLWRRSVQGTLDVELITVTLPSSSATPGRNVLRFDEKLARWRELLCE